MSTELQRTCPDCGSEFSGAMEFCPVCMLRKALDGDVEPGDSTSEDAVKPTAEPVAQRFENYELVQGDDGTPVELGRGAMGVTYKALDVDLHCFVTLKVISERYLGDESARLRFLREARAAASVRHPNVASVLHLGRTGSSYFYAMEFVEGETLERLIRRSGRLEVKLALEIATQVAAGLAAVHKQKLVHRDIKPSNIMVSVEDGSTVTAKVIDLGLAKPAPDAPAEAPISTPGAFAGTPEFASPEQFAGVGVDIRSDLYSLGAVLWEMLTGQAPFGGTSGEVMYQHQHTSLPLEQLKGVRQPVIVLLEALLEKDPVRRFQSPAELLKALPKVTDALKARRTITHQSLREIVDQPLGATGKAIEVLTNVRKAIAAPRVRLVLWPALILMIGGGAILAFNVFFGPKGSPPQVSRSSSPAVTAPEKSVAVLPFENISANKDDTYFADGVQDEILTNLAKIEQLKVISRTSVMKYRAGAERDLRQIASALGVANVLEGTVRRAGNRVRVSTKLVDARNDNTIWADSYDRDLTDIFAIQSEIAQKVAARLNAQLSPEERKDIEEKPTSNLEAYDLYLQAKQLLNSVVMWGSTKGTYSKAISLLEEATRKDQQFALAYCLIAKAHDYLYWNWADPTPERRALGDAAVNEALRLRPDIPEVHLATARHLFLCYRDAERARVHIAIAAQTLSNNADLLHLTALTDRAQGRWEKSTADLEKAASLDPRDPDLIETLGWNYLCLRRYRDEERILDRLIELEPDQPLFPLRKALSGFAEKADVKSARAACEALPLSMKDDPDVTFWRVLLATCARDFAAAEEILSKSPSQELFFFGVFVPRRIGGVWLELAQGNHPTMEQFGAAREQLYRKVEADPSNPLLMTALALTDSALGRNEEGIKEGRRAMEMRSISEDAFDGPVIATNVALAYVWANRLDLAFEQLNIVIRLPNSRLTYGDLKTNPGWDPLRKDPRFEKLLAELAPKD
jgi:serine/threonine protein kinase/tetratricopeptide (TPR) repeat protein